MTETHTTESRWRYLANLRQGIIAKLEKKLTRAEAEILTLRTSLDAATTRLAMYDQREAA